MVGELNVLNVGAGDIRVTFNHIDQGETKKALRMLKDMQQRGYAIMVALPDGTYTRAKTIDPTTNSYVIVVAEDAPLPTDAVVEKTRGRKKGKTGTKSAKVPVRTSRAVGVARSAGG